MMLREALTLPSGQRNTVVCDMPHWLALLAIVVAAWLVLTVVGGWLIGRGLGAIERHQEVDET